MQLDAVGEELIKLEAYLINLKDWNFIEGGIVEEKIHARFLGLKSRELLLKLARFLGSAASGASVI
jgi:hypothetical protein